MILEKIPRCLQRGSLFRELIKNAALIALSIISLYFVNHSVTDDGYFKILLLLILYSFLIPPVGHDTSRYLKTKSVAMAGLIVLLTIAVHVYIGGFSYYTGCICVADDTPFIDAGTHPKCYQECPGVADKFQKITQVVALWAYLYTMIRLKYYLYQDSDDWHPLFKSEESPQDKIDRTTVVKDFIRKGDKIDSKIVDLELSDD